MRLKLDKSGMRPNLRLGTDLTMTFSHCGVKVSIDALQPTAIDKLRCPICGQVRWSTSGPT